MGWEDLNVILNQNMPNLHNGYKSVERKTFMKNPGLTTHWHVAAIKIWTYNKAAINS